MGRLQGIFSADYEEIASMLGKEAYFGECLGKHSEVIVNLTKEMFKEINCSSEFEIEFCWLFPKGFGKHPLSSKYVLAWQENDE